MLQHHISFMLNVKLGTFAISCFSDMKYKNVNKLKAGHRPVSSEELVAFFKTIVEKHIDAFKSQLCVVNVLRLVFLHASRG